MWKIEKIVKKGDYNYAVVYNHPNSTKHGYVLEHWIVVENHLGRILDKDEVVHHKNENKLDNRIKNLEVLTKSSHASEHALVGRLWVELKCPNCKIIFDRPQNKTHFKDKKREYTCCSKSCATHFHNKKSVLDIKSFEKSVSENVIKIYKNYPPIA